jgi:hypothetical protein
MCPPIRARLGGPIRGGFLVFSLGRTPASRFDPGQNARAFGSLSGVGGQPCPTVFPRMRAPHLLTPDAAPPCLPPRAPRDVTLCCAVGIVLAAPRRRLHSSPSLSRRRAFPLPLLPIQAPSVPLRSDLYLRQLLRSDPYLCRLLRSDLYLR